MDDKRWREIWDAFTVARELPERERHVYAQSAVTDPEALHELLAMLAQEETAEESGGSSVTAAGPAADHGNGPLEYARVGQTIGRFVIDGPIGRGGMGEVYRARDTELNRTVALKLLSSADMGSREHMTRFLREAQAASALNHPGIVTVYDVLRDGSAIGIVMELIDGEPMRAICGKPHPVARVADWGRQIAMALAAAHAAKIVHRDIKPENLMLRRDGLVKVLDFGLARQAEGSILESATTRFAGTLRYMAPEQVHGEPPKPASDIFTLGIVLYELATGVHPFGYESAPAAEVRKPEPAGSSSSPASDALLVPYLITAIEPRPASAVEPSAPAELSDLLTEMLRKDPADRPNAKSVADRLLAIQQTPADATKPRRRASWPRVRRVAIAAVGLSVAVAGLLWMWRATPPTRAVPMVLEGLPLTGARGNETNPAFSPDGRQITYAWDGGSSARERSIYVRLVDGGNPLRLTRGGDDDNPVWSPDASKVAFLRYSSAGVQVMVVPALGGAYRVLGTIADGRLMRHKLLTWSPDADELIVVDRPDGPESAARLSLYSLRVGSGQKRRLTHPPEGTDDLAPVFSPDGRKLAFLRKHGSLYEFHVKDEPAGPARLLAAEPDVEGLAWLPDSRSLIFCTDASPPRRVQTISEAGGKAAPADFQFGSAVGALVLSPASGRMAFVHQQKDRNIWALAKGDPGFRPLIASTRADEDARVSPDGQRIAFTSNRTGAYDIWVCERDGSNPRPVTSQRVFAGSAAWSPNSRTLAYDTAIEGPTEIWLVNPDGGPPRRLLDPPLPGFIPNWSADGASIYFVGKGLQIWRATLAGGPPRQVTRHGGLEGFETFDGKYFYFSRKIGSSGIWRLPVAGGEEELLPELASVRPFRSWDMARDGIYYAEADPKPVLKFYRFRDRKTSFVTDLPRPPQQSERGLSVAPDGSLILYVQVDSIRNEILLAEIPQ